MRLLNSLRGVVRLMLPAVLAACWLAWLCSRSFCWADLEFAEHFLQIIHSITGAVGGSSVRPLDEVLAAREIPKP